MTSKKIMQSPNADFTTKEDLEEALLILEVETKRRVEDIRRRMEFICASLRAQGGAQINKMLMAVRELTVDEYCETYGADTQDFLDQQTAKRLVGNNKKRPLHNESKDSIVKKRRKSNNKDEKNEVPATDHQDFGLLFVHIEREKSHPKISIRFDPGHTVDELGKLKLTAPNGILTQLNDAQRRRVRDQIQELQDQLDDLKKSLS